MREKGVCIISKKKEVEKLLEITHIIDVNWKKQRTKNGALRDTTLDA